MKVLITNDDGIKAENLKLLVQYISKYYDDILVLAPTEEQSAVSHKINISNAISRSWFLSKWSKCCWFTVFI